ncbi:MAG: DNA polymerase/3'-5' exonuclease PolX [Chloroflexota bacterium]|nr:DNA polymerase/3'-5' exonuclease PolX [Chloroflexota bacterium]
MPVYNSDVVDIFNEVADLLEIEGANEFRVRAYRKGARTISTLSRNVAHMVEAGEDLTELPGIGEDLAGKIEEIVHTGDLKQLAELRQRTPPELAEMLDVAGLGPKRVQTIYEELGVTTLEELRQAAAQGKIRDLYGLGEKTEQKILDDLERLSAEGERERTRRDVAEERVEPLLQFLRGLDAVERVEAAGSYRRKKETVGDLDILATSEAGEAVISRFVEYEDVEAIVSQGETRSTVVFRSGLHVDLRVVEERSYGAALLYFTGSKAHNIALRNMALDRGWKINEYGVWDTTGEAAEEEQIAGESEEEMYVLLDLPWIAPELREDRGEVEAAREGRLPDLITLDDVRGDLQCHTTASDGRASLEEMARAAQALGREYLAITDHSAYIGVTQGLDAEELERRMDEIDQLNERMEDIVLLKSVEVDIMEDGSLDLPDRVLEKLDLVTVAVHSHFDLPAEEQTERLIRAMDNPNCNILAHPTGRQIDKRPGYAIDLDRLMDAALERGCFMEINAQPDRLDLDDVASQMARERGLKLAISTDAHSTEELAFMRFGVYQGRRGWLEPEDVLNTRSWDDLKDLIAR